MDDIAVIIKDLWIWLGGRLVLGDVNLEIQESRQSSPIVS